MRFLVLTQYFAPEVGATQIRLATLCKELISAGHKVEVVTAMPHHPGGRIFPAYRGRFYLRGSRDGMTIHRLWLYAANGSGLKRIINYLSFMLTSLVGLCRVQPPDFVFVDSPPLFLAVPAWFTSRRWRRPLIFNVADLWPDSVRDLGVMNDGMLLRAAEALEHWIYRNADWVTAVTEGIRDALLHKKRVPPRKVLFLPNGVDTRLICPLAPDETLKRKLRLSGKSVILYAGNHGYAGALDQILNAAQELSQRQEIHFLFIGDGPEKRNLQAQASDLGLRNVTFLETVPLGELAPFISIADCAVVTLRKAGVMRGARPAKLFVMMAAAKPVVLAAEGEAAALLESAGAGLVVPPETPRALASAILSLLADPDEARRMGRNGRAFVENHFEWSALVQDWLSQLTSIPRQQQIFDPARHPDDSEEPSARAVL